MPIISTNLTVFKVIIRLLKSCGARKLFLKQIIIGIVGQNDRRYSEI